MIHFCIFTAGFFKVSLLYLQHMAKTAVTLENIRSVVKEVVGEELDTKLQPLRDDIAEIKHVVERRVYKEMKEGFKIISDRIETLENASTAIFETHESDLKKVKQHIGLGPI